MYTVIPPLPIQLDEDHVDEAREKGLITEENKHIYGTIPSLSRFL
jgi:hypothetical protein